MDRKNQKLNLAQAVASPVLTGNNDKFTWTGLPKSEDIDYHMIPDEKMRIEFVRKVRDVENSIRRYKNATRPVNSVLMVNANQDDPNKIETHILKVCREIKNILNNPDSIGLDIDIFWVSLCREYEEIRKYNPHEFKAMSKEARENLEIFRSYMNSNEPPVRELYVPEKNRYVCLQFLTRGQEEKLNNGTKTNSEILLEIMQSIRGKESLTGQEGTELLRELVGPITLVDLPLIFPNKRYADMQYITVFKNYLIGKDRTYEEIEAMSIQDIVDEAMKTYNFDNIHFHSCLVADTVINGIKYLDIEKLMLLAMARPLESYDMMSPKVMPEESTESEIMKKLVEKEEENVAKLQAYNVEETQIGHAIEKTRRTEFIIKKILESGIISKRTSFKIIAGSEEKEVSLKRIQELMENFCDGIYLSDAMQLGLIYDAYYKENEMDSWSDELLQRMDFSENDMQVLSTVNFNNLRRLYSLGKMNKDQIRELLIEASNGRLNENIDLTFTNTNNETRDLMKKKLRDLFKNLYNSGIIDAKDVRQYFEEVIVTPDMLDTLEEDKAQEEIEQLHKDLATEFNQEMLLGKYKEYVEAYLGFMKFQTQNPDKTDEIEKLRNRLGILRTEKELYREAFYKYNHISEKEKHQFGEELLENYYIEMDVTDEAVLKESIKTFYEDGMIDLENIVHMDREYIIPMLDKLSLEDANKVRKSMTFEQLEDLLDNIFDNPEFTDERRFIVVMNMLGEDTEEDKNAREFYLGMLDFNDSERRSETHGKRKIKNRGIGKDSNKYVYPDIVKWKFYKALDKDVRVTRYSNGFVEFASSKLGARIIEKYYDGDKPAYGTATYILSEEAYRENANDLVTIVPNGSILESSTLKDITPRKDRIAHRTQSTDKTGMDEMVKYFDIDYERQNDSRYSPEELKELQATVSKYKTEYEMIL